MYNINVKSNLNESLIYEIGDSIDSLIAEAEEDIKVEHDHNAVTETPVDRKEVKRAEIDYDKLADKVLNYSAQNIPENEDALNKLAHKLGV